MSLFWEGEMSEEIPNEITKEKTDEILRIIAVHSDKQNKLLQELIDSNNRINGKLTFFTLLIILGMIVSLLNFCTSF